MSVRASSALVAAALVTLSCDHEPTPPAEALHGALGGGIVARVGDVAISGSLVGEVARAQRTNARVALDRLIDDALAAQGARASGADHDPSVRWTLESIVARAAADRIRHDTQAAGPPTDEELAQVTRIHWLEVDLPEQERVIHALVGRPKDPSQSDAARALAALLASAAAGAKDEDDFKARVSSVPHGAIDVTVEEIPPFVADGRFADTRPSALDPAFARGAFALKNVGDTSGVVESAYGWHVIRLLERLTAKVLPAAERRTRFAEEVFAHRGRVAMDSTLESRRTASPVAILPDADARMAEVSPAEAP